MSLYEEIKKRRGGSLRFRLIPVRDKKGYSGIVAKSTILEDARKRKKDRETLITLDKFFTTPTIAG